MTISKDGTNLSELDQAIAHYSQALDNIKSPHVRSKDFSPCPPEAL
ncbi:MAG: hypothetical protein GDA48_14200 [Hormoscilla sp. GM102CHS1]|nr:hypothetical protein [Hormoscilla sp. GM102CHS1]